MHSLMHVLPCTRTCMHAQTHAHTDKLRN